MSKMLVSVCLALVIVSVSYAENPPLLVSSWETQADIDATATWGGSVLVPFQNVGVTDGEYSLGCLNLGFNDPTGNPPNQAWKWLAVIAGQLSLDGGIGMHNAVSVDITTLAADFEGVEKVTFGFAVCASNTGWVQTATPGTFLPEWNPGMGDRTATMTFDYSAFKTGPIVPQWNCVGVFMDSYRVEGGEATSSMLYLDNLRLTGTPEPATMALLGLGGLALIRRKR